MNNQILGYNYEIQVRDYIISQNKMAYLWSHTPENILIEHNIIGSHNIARLKRKENKLNPLIDTGIDIIQIDNSECSLVQCKNGYKKGLKMEDLAGFNAWMSALDTLKGYVYYTDKLSQNILSLPKNKRIEYIKQPFKQNIIEENIVLTKYKPYDYQEIAVNKFIEHFSQNNRGILSMPCGTGKTLVAYLIGCNYKQIILLSPLKQFAQQNLEKFVSYGYKNKTLLVDSDGERDINEINKFINSNKSFLISSTFCSIDVIIQCNFTNSLFIIDEFHNLSKNNITNKDDDFYKLLNSNHKILFMSATPRVYELENEDYNDEIFGNIFYTMNFTEAIEKKYITDYKILLPSIHEDNITLNNELSIYEIDEVVKAKCKFLYSCLLNNGARKCIIYCVDTNEIKIMIDAFSKLNDFYFLDFDISQITSSNSASSRNKILTNFTSNNNLQLLFSVRILDECIDIPSCDSIYITYPSKSKIRTIQRLSRCIRINKKNPFKIGYIFIWCDKYDEILETLSGIKEYDLFFKDKIIINKTNFFGDSNNELYIKDVEIIKKYIIDIKEFKQISWNEKLKMVEEYIITNNKKPSQTDNNVKQLGWWISNQIKNYTNNKEIMSNPNIRLEWKNFTEKYKQYFLNDDEAWNNKLEELENFIINKNKKPSVYIDEEKTLANFMYSQESLYKLNKIDESRKNIWKNFSNKYKISVSNEDKWYQNLLEVEQFIEKNKSKPKEKSKNKDEAVLGKWISKNKENYKNNVQIMKESHIRKKFEEFVKKYNCYLLSKTEIWQQNLENVQKFIEENDRRPSSTATNEDEKYIGIWLVSNLQNYKNSNKSMNDDNQKKLWIEFYDKYKIYLLPESEKWFCIIDLVEKYINENNELPPENSNNKKIKYLNIWIQNQKYNNNNNIMKDKNIKAKWNNFTKEFHNYL
jgi:superfamily II DNA or RNA helicase